MCRTGTYRVAIGDTRVASLGQSVLSRRDNVSSRREWTVLVGSRRDALRSRRDALLKKKFFRFWLNVFGCYKLVSEPGLRDLGVLSGLI